MSKITSIDLMLLSQVQGKYEVCDILGHGYLVFQWSYRRKTLKKVYINHLNRNLANSMPKPGRLDVAFLTVDLKCLSR